MVPIESGPAGPLRFGPERQARDFILQTLQDASRHLSKTNRLRATTHILLEGGVKLTKSNSFTIDHRDQLLLMSLATRLLQKTDGEDAGSRPAPG